MVADYGNPQMLDMVDCGARNRLSTLFWYLNTVPEGGETYFPRALNASGVEYNRWNYNYADCYLGLAVKPRQGSGVLFYSMLPNSELDERSLHGGCPPRGESKSKWGANQVITLAYRVGCCCCGDLCAHRSTPYSPLRPTVDLQQDGYTQQWPVWPTNIWPPIRSLTTRIVYSYSIFYCTVQT
jgi:hypothetical protein